MPESRQVLSYGHRPDAGWFVVFSDHKYVWMASELCEYVA